MNKKASIAIEWIIIIIIAGVVGVLIIYKNHEAIKNYFHWGNTLMCKIDTKNYLADCPCDDENAAKVFRVDINRYPDLEPCLKYSYDCGDDKCWPRSQVADGLNTPDKCGQSRDFGGDDNSFISANKMIKDKNGNLLAHCATDIQVCEVRIAKNCEKQTNPELDKTV